MIKDQASSLRTLFGIQSPKTPSDVVRALHDLREAQKRLNSAVELLSRRGQRGSVAGSIVRLTCEIEGIIDHVAALE